MAVRWTGDPGSLKLDVEKPFIMWLEKITWLFIRQEKGSKSE